MTNLSLSADGRRTATGFSPDCLHRLGAAIQREVDTGQIPGAAILLARGGIVGYQQAFGRLGPDQATAMTPDAIFRIYSMTKPIVSVAVMMLVEQGRLLLTDPVAQWLPEFAELQVAREMIGDDGVRRMHLEACQRPMTVQDLLRHTAGLTYGIFGTPTLVKAAYTASGIESRTITNSTLVAGLARLPLAFQPGTVWEYSRATDVLGALLERLSGQTLDNYLEQTIFTPLAMHDTGFEVALAQQHRIAEPFALDPTSGKAVRLIDVRSRPDFLSGGGGLVSTLQDYWRFARMLQCYGELDGVRLLSRKTIEFMTSDHLAGLPRAMQGPTYLPGPGYGFGLGFAVRNCPGAAATPGSVGEFHWSGLAGTFFWIDPKEDLVAIWMMQAPEQRDRFRQLVRNLVQACVL